jgi:predicted extracellular nuclease
MRNIFPVALLILAGCGGSGGSGPSPMPAPAPPEPTPISAVQGSGASSALSGDEVVVEGIVTGDFQDNDTDTAANLGGFYLQGTADGDHSTSDGVFVFDGGQPVVDVAPGDSVRVEGTVNEYFGETQVRANRVTVIGSGSIEPVDLDMTATSSTTTADGDRIVDLEHLEGMLVRLVSTMTVTSLWELEAHGSVMLSAGGRQYQYTNLNAPDVGGHANHDATLASRRLLLDDGRRDAYATPIRFLNAGAAVDYSIRIGDQVDNATGVLRYSRGSGSSGTEGYRLVPTEPVRFAPANPRPGVPAVSGAIRVGSFNLLNLFATTDAGADVCGPSANRGCFGADSADEQRRQVAKLVAALTMMDADIAGLVELENDASASLELLVDALNEAEGAGSYDYIDTGVLGTANIKTGLVYRPATVRPAGPFAVLDGSVDERFNSRLNRPALAQTFARIDTGAALTVVVNHLKSKGFSCASVGDPDLGDGQDDCNLTRTRAAAAMADWLAGDPTASGDPDFLIIGDLNANMQEDPIVELENAGYVNLLETMLGPTTYSFAFDGQSGALDHALASPTLAPQVADVREWHINADEPAVLDYNLENDRDPALFDATTPYRSSDHDPLIIGIDLTL